PQPPVPAAKLLPHRNQVARDHAAEIGQRHLFEEDRGVTMVDDPEGEALGKAERVLKEARASLEQDDFRPDRPKI
ncbi:hypothetical protein ACC710_37820, partial [Rhizobium ruizarguesonis]